MLHNVPNMGRPPTGGHLFKCYTPDRLRTISVVGGGSGPGPGWVQAGSRRGLGRVPFGTVDLGQAVLEPSGGTEGGGGALVDVPI